MSFVDCPECRGYGEVAVPGTYGPTISPENLELVRCPRCEGTGEYREEREEEQP
jgi:uncharacterized protein YbaR (Trm112 family)